jgi:hypothetical protein
MDKELTFGQRLMGINFNPSKDPKVDKVKALMAEVADIVESNVLDGEQDYLYNLVRGIALKELLLAQMSAVKLLTLK